MCIRDRGFIAPRHKQAIEKLGAEVFLSCDKERDWVEMFNHPDFDEVTHVSICTPNYLHSVITREALLKGKKVLCEKPLSINGTEGLDGVKTVLQLRYHPELQKINKPKELQVTAKMFRDDKYWKSWKGNEVMSGGILYNLGVHYVDLAIFLLGDSWEIIDVYKTDKKVTATVRFGESLANFHIEVVNNRDEQGRKLIADGKEITLSNQDNLSYEDLHTEVYKEFLAGRGIGIDESEKSLKLISAICQYKK
jgi:UDP-N-acetyl-2-amino-2-deoxyglucuronate dehydrogenase